MKQYYNDKLMVQAVQSEFVYLNSDNNKKFKEFKYKNNKLKNYKVLNLIELHKDLKQFIKALFFLKKNKFFESSEIFFWTEKKIFIDLLIQIQNYCNTTKQLFISNKSPIMEKKKHIFLINLGVPYYKYNKHLIKTLLINNIFTVYRLNYEYEKINFGSYKLRNDCNDYKQLIFLLILIIQVIKKL